MITYIHSILSSILPERALMFIVEQYYKSLRMLLNFLRLKYMPNFVLRILKSNGIEVIQFDSIENYSIDQPGYAEYISRKTTDLYYSKPCFDYLHFETSMIKRDKAFAQYAVILKEVYVIGGSNVMLTQSGKALYELKYCNPANKFRYTDGALLADNDQYGLLKTKDSNLVFEEGILMAGNFSFSYYHLLYEILAKFQQVDELDPDISIPFLVDKINIDLPQYRELFTLLNTRGRKIISMEKGIAHRVKKLYHFSCPNFIPPNYWDIKDIRAVDNLFDLDSLSYLRSSLLKMAKPMDFPKRIFLSRRKASARRRFNETEVIKLLEGYGFETVFPEDYSVAEQISMFNQADFIAGGSGGAFTNILFCKAGCKVFCFSNYAFDLSIFTTIAKHVEVDLLYIIDDSKDISKVKDIHESFSIDLKKLDEIVKHWTN